MLFWLALALICLGSCGHKIIKKEQPKTDSIYADKNDSAFYGLACEGSSDSVIIVLPMDGSDPVRFNCLLASRSGRILGNPAIGDRVCVMRNKKDSTVADLVVDIDELKGIWCYIVMPTMRDTASMTSREQRRYLDAMPDSVKNTYLIPREYGFWLKSNAVCSSVGYVQEQSALEEVSPMIYPPLGYFVQWHMWNGKVIIISGDPFKANDGSISVNHLFRDTCNIDYLRDDSLVLSDRWGVRGYYRKNDINEVNVKAKAIAAKLSSEALKNIKEE